MSTRDMLSVGIDVGTTTTQLVLSDLAISEPASFRAIVEKAQAAA